jgi:hypothetical protein
MYICRKTRLGRTQAGSGRAAVQLFDQPGAAGQWPSGRSREKCQRDHGRTLILECQALPQSTLMPWTTLPLAPDSCELRDCGQVQSRVCGEADAEGALDGFCSPRTMTEREPTHVQLRARPVQCERLRRRPPDMPVVSCQPTGAWPPERERQRERRRAAEAAARAARRAALKT